ncbi:MAG: GNAT family N-acetyltransferase, partial [Chloroflexota bacterium]|nr:GNAT family N-acetyltransferase [Chloroflexota bacterium]
MKPYPSTAALLELPTADDAILKALHELQNRVNAERFPADPPVPYAQREREWRQDGTCWVVYAPDSLLPIGNAWIGIPAEQTKQHLIEFDLLVLPEHRRQGVGRSLLAAVANVATQAQRSLLLVQTNSHVPAGAHFLQHIGGRPSRASCTLQLGLTTFDRDLFPIWTARMHAQAPEFELGFWAGAYPADALTMMAQLHDLHNEAPHRSATIGANHTTAEALRQREAELDARQEIRWTMYVRERGTGRIVGFSEASWQRDNPTTVEQGVTAVLPAYRRCGFAHWVKAA